MSFSPCDHNVVSVYENILNLHKREKKKTLENQTDMILHPEITYIYMYNLRSIKDVWIRNYFSFNKWICNATRIFLFHLSRRIST